MLGKFSAFFEERQLGITFQNFFWYSLATTKHLTDPLKSLRANGADALHAFQTQGTFI